MKLHDKRGPAILNEHPIKRGGQDRIERDPLLLSKID